MSSEEATVPAAVRRQQKQAEERRAAAYGTETPPEEEARTEGDEGADAPPKSEPPTDPPNAEDEPAPGPKGDEPEDDEDTGEKDWKAEYEKLSAQHSTLKGKYDSEVPRLSHQVRELREKLETTEKQIEEARATGAPAAGGTGDEEVDAKLAAVREEYGEDLIETLTLIARRMVSEANQPLREEIGKVTDRQELSDRDRFYATLADDVPGWEKVNSDPAFHAWLAEVDPLTGSERQKALESAYGKLDAPRVVAIFNLFLEQSGRKPAATEDDDDDDNLESHVAPDSRRTPPREPEEPKTYTKADMDQLERDARSGKITDAQYQERMSEIQKAIREGRYRPT